MWPQGKVVCMWPLPFALNLEDIWISEPGGMPASEPFCATLRMTEMLRNTHLTYPSASEMWSKGTVSLRNHSRYVFTSPGVICAVRHGDRGVGISKSWPSALHTHSIVYSASCCKLLNHLYTPLRILLESSLTVVWCGGCNYCDSLRCLSHTYVGSAPDFILCKIHWLEVHWDLICGACVCVCSVEGDLGPDVVCG